MGNGHGTRNDVWQKSHRSAVFSLNYFADTLMFEVEDVPSWKVFNYSFIAIDDSDS